MRTSKYYILWGLLFYSYHTIAQSNISVDTIKRIGLEKQIDSIVTNAITQKAFPGCVVYAARQDSMVFFKAYGHHTYDSTQTVTIHSIYDLASITKVVGATLALMKLYEDSLLHLDDPIHHYVDGIRGKVGKVTIREALAHQGGLYPWIPYYKKIRNRKGVYRKKHVSDKRSLTYSFKLSEGLYLHRDFYKQIKRFIRRSKVEKNPTYQYSGLFFYLIPEIVENLSGRKYEEYLQDHFYHPMKAETMGFQPLLKFDQSLIVPTEIDSFFRMKPIHGAVHDEGAIMMGGVSGNAGLFSNALDLAKVMQMLSNGGQYDSLDYLKPQTIELFNTVHYPNLQNRRGLGFDKPLLKYDAVKSSVAQSVSRSSFGHTGYTGTLVWVDPDKELIYIFLSNRVYPSRKNTKIYQLNVRPTIHQILYNYIEDSDDTNGNTVEKTK